MDKPPREPLDAVQAGLRAARLILGVSQRDVAEGSGVALSRISASERGLAKLTAGEVGRIWEFLVPDPTREDVAGWGGTPANARD